LNAPQDTGENDFKKILGEFAQYSFIGIALISILGAYLYENIGIHTPVVSAFLILIVIILSIQFLPNQSNRKNIFRSVY